MEQIIIQVQDKEKAKMLFELLKALDFVYLVNTSEKKDTEIDMTTTEESLDFFSLAGLWKNREINLESIRKKAWPRRYI